MNHIAELKLHQYMTDAVNGKSTMSDEIIHQVADDIKDALQRQFGGKVKRKDFTLRMSNVGRPTCQLWYEKNKPETALPKSNNFMMNMMLGDIVEAVFKGLLKAAKVEYQESDTVTLKCKDAEVSGSYDLVIDGAVDDVKSASDWSYRNKFERCFEPETEMFRGKPTGHKVLNTNCKFCDYRYDCWNLTDKPAVMSKAQTPKIVSYVDFVDNVSS